MATTVATRKFGKAAWLPETGIPVATGDGLSRSAVSRRFKALTQARYDEWMSSDISHLDLVAIRIDGLHMRDDDGMPMLAAAGIETSGPSIRRASSRAPRRTPPPCRPFSTT